VWPGSAEDERPALSFAFQHLALLPWRTVAGNIAFPLETEGSSGGNGNGVQEMIDALGLHGFENYYPAQLSGGMRHRVALARALITKPKLLILDEPFGALDVHARMKVQDLLIKTCSETGLSAMMVSHDLHEAARMSDRILVLSVRPARILEEFMLPAWSGGERVKIGPKETAPYVERLQSLLRGSDSGQQD
jgi:NitT/TauT family transport system ATP-binding protein